MSFCNQARNIIKGLRKPVCICPVLQAKKPMQKELT
jgi:hypothetical protein